MTSSAHPPPPGSGRTGGRGLPALLALLAAGPAWLRGGTYADWMHPWLWLAAAVLAVVLFQNRAPEHRARLLRDPVAWLGLLFITLLVLQWSNAGRALYFDADAGRWTHSQPPRPGWPFAFTAGEARQMLDWFVPAWVLVVGLRSPALGSAGVRRCWRLLAYQAGALAVFGLAQYATRTPRMYGVFPMETPFFAAFGYQNHAGSYFLLVLPLALGLLSHEGAVDGQPRRRARLFGLGLVALLALVACNLSLSRVSIVAGWAMLLPLGLLLLAFFWPRLEAAQRLNIVATGAATLCLAGLLVFGLGREAIRREFKPEKDQKTFLQRETDFRGFQLRAAVRIWQDHPWFGVGGWGYRYLLGHYLPPEEWSKVSTGKANVHNDPVQFLAEFGAVGAGLLAAVVVALLAAVVRSGVGWPPLVLFPVLGAGLIGLQGLIDLPFRSPAVLYLWLACLAGAARVLRPARIAAHAS
jgi:hypothetical protein